MDGAFTRLAVLMPADRLEQPLWHLTVSRLREAGRVVVPIGPAELIDVADGDLIVDAIIGFSHYRSVIRRTAASAGLACGFVDHEPKVDLLLQEQISTTPVLTASFDGWVRSAVALEHFHVRGVDRTLGVRIGAASRSVQADRLDVTQDRLDGRRPAVRVRVTRRGAAALDELVPRETAVTVEVHCGLLAADRQFRYLAGPGVVTIGPHSTSVREMTAPPVRSPQHQANVT